MARDFYTGYKYSSMIRIIWFFGLLVFRGGLLWWKHITDLLFLHYIPSTPVRYSIIPSKNRVKHNKNNCFASLRAYSSKPRLCTMHERRQEYKKTVQEKGADIIMSWTYGYQLLNWGLNTRYDAHRDCLITLGRTHTTIFLNGTPMTR